MDLEQPLVPEDMVRIHRVGRKLPNKQRQVILRFKSYQTRINIYRQKKKLVGSQYSVNEDLTQSRAYNLYLARTAKREGKLMEAWSYNGRICVRDNANKIHQDMTYASLTKLVGPLSDTRPLPQPARDSAQRSSHPPTRP